MMKTLTLCAAATMLLLSSSVFSGAFSAGGVVIAGGSDGNARGTLSAVRASDNDVERIGCAIGYGYVRGHYAYCEATDADGIVAGCITDDVDMINTIASINTFSFVYFEWDGEQREPGELQSDWPTCAHVTVATRSTHIPEKIKIDM